MLDRYFAIVLNLIVELLAKNLRSCLYMHELFYGHIALDSYQHRPPGFVLLCLPGISKSLDSMLSTTKTQNQNKIKKKKKNKVFSCQSFLHNWIDDRNAKAVQSLDIQDSAPDDLILYLCGFKSQVQPQFN